MTYDEKQLHESGFAEISIEDGMANAVAYTADCSGSRSDCCTRTCKPKVEGVGAAADWDSFLDVQGGQIQY
jgi:hypothetical protein